MLPDPDPRPAHPAGRGPLPRGLLPDGATVGPAGRLSIGGVDLLDLVADIGTPVFVYDEEHLRCRCREAVAAWT
ncbi:MAG: diaminopimelate decarboxylase, partial [Acidimicrobiales bacterium]